MKLNTLLTHSPLLFALAFTTQGFAAKSDVTKDSSATKTLSAIIALDQSEVMTSIDASHKKSSEDVADFAKMMIEDHGKNFSDALELANKIHALPLSNNTEIAGKEMKELTTLGSLDGDEFDHAYIDAMVKGHSAALTLVEEKLKSAKDDDLKSFLSSTKDAISHHLDEAKNLQDKIQRQGVK